MEYSVNYLMEAVMLLLLLFFFVCYRRVSIHSNTNYLGNNVFYDMTSE